MRFLRTAIDAGLDGRQPTIAATSSPGCAIELLDTTTAAESPVITYARDISRIIQSNCVQCHRSGGVAPFSLETFESVSRRAGMIKYVVDEGIMPPWFAAEREPDQHSPWLNDRALSETEKAAIRKWIEDGKPKGDDADLPKPRVFPEGEWTIGPPDAVYDSTPNGPASPATTRDTLRARSLAHAPSPTARSP